MVWFTVDYAGKVTLYFFIAREEKKNKTLYYRQNILLAERNNV